MLLISIVDRGRGELVAQIFDRNELHFNFIFHGTGTASSEILSLLGLGTSDKDLVISFMPCHKLTEMLKLIGNRMHLKRPGKGIAFTMPLESINALIAASMTQKKAENGGKKMDQTVNYSLILAAINPGFIDDVMEVARNAGATGGTVVHARGIGTENDANFLGMNINTEKEILAILATKETKKQIMQAINSFCGLKSEAQAIVFSLPVYDMVGLE